MDTFSELIRLRRSIRKFTDEPVSDEQLRLIMRSALMAPSSKGTHSYEFVVVDDKEKLTCLASCKARGGEFLAEAPVAIVVAGNPEVSDVWVEDASVAATMMLLQAEDLGLGGCWVQMRERSDADGADAEQNIRNLLGIPANIRILCVVAVGHKGMERKPQNEERLLWEKVHRGEWK